MPGLSEGAAPHNANAGGAPVSDIRARFGGAVRTSRLRQHLTQEQLAERCGLSQKFIGEVERGVANPTIETVARIASALLLEVAELFGAAAAAYDDHYRMSRRDLQVVREVADSLESLVERYPPHPDVRYPPLKRRRRKG